MIVVAAVLVVDPQQQRRFPGRAVHHRIDHRGREGLAELDVLRVLLRVGAEVRVHDGNRGQCPRRRVGEELLRGPQVPHAPGEAERVQVGGERLVAADGVGHPRQPPAKLGEPPHRDQAAPAEQPREHHRGRVHVVVVHPGDVVGGQRVEDRPRGRVVDQVPRQVVDQAVRGAGDQEPPVRERRPQAGAEPAVRHREGARKPVVERQLGLRPVAHRHGRVAPGHGLPDAGREPAAGAVGVGDVAGVPGLGGVAVDLRGGGQVVGRRPAARWAAR